jgi:hypothetical protein
LPSQLPAADRVPPPARVSDTEEAIVARFVKAYEAADMPALIELFTDDVFMSMPPIPLEYRGLEPVAAFCEMLFSSGRTFSLVATRANAQPAFGTYVVGADGARHANGLIVLALAGGRIRALTRFEAEVLPRFGLPQSLPSR